MGSFTLVSSMEVTTSCKGKEGLGGHYRVVSAGSFPF